MFIQIHALRSFPPHIPNRGGDGLAKRAIYGDIERQRISYQCHQNAIKTHASIDAMNDHFGQTLRSCLIGSGFINPLLVEKGMDEAEASEWTNAIMKLWFKKSEDDEKGNSKKKDSAPPGEKTAQVLVVGKKEAEALAYIALSLRSAGVTADKLSGVITKNQTNTILKAMGFSREDESIDTVKAALDAVHAFHSIVANAGFDGALFGRMATGEAVSTVRRAVRFSDWLTTHAITPVSDFFSTNDMLKDTVGGGHINNRELGAGIFYQHAVIDVQQLKDNLAVEDVTDVVEWVIRALIEVDPVNGRANSRLIDLGIQVGREQPRSLMDAFIGPVEAMEVKARLHQFAEEQHRLDGLGIPQFWLSVSGVEAVGTVIKELIEN